jgi:hypothetical protein
MSYTVVFNKQERTLRLDNQDGTIVASATSNWRGMFRWFSSITGRTGRGFSFESAEDALRAAACRMAWP